MSGYQDGTIANMMGIAPSSVQTYIKRLKEHFEDEPEAQSGLLAPKQALERIGPRYFQQFQHEELTEIDLPFNELGKTAKLVEDLIRNYKSWSDLFYEMRTVGEARLVISKAEIIQAEIQDTIAIVPDRYRPDLLRARFGVLFEQGAAHTEVTLSTDLRYKVTPIVTKMEGIAQELGDSESHGLNGLLRGSIQYLLKEYKESINTFQKAAQFLTSPDDQIWALRTMALNFALMEAESGFKRSEFKKVENRIETLIKKGLDEDRFQKPERVCLGWEGIGRGQAILQIPDVDPFDTFEKGREMHILIEEKGGRAPFRMVEIGRSELVAAGYVAPQDKKLIEDRGTESLRIAKEYGHQRHKDLIEVELSKLLNN